MRSFTMALVLALVMVGQQVQAGAFVIAGFGSDLGKPVAEAVADLVTDEFTHEFPATSFQLVVLYDHAKLDTDNVCFAVSGVVPVPQNKLAPVIPGYRFTNIYRDRVDANAKSDAKQKCLLEAIRGSVKAMMAERASDLRRRAELP